jgi:nicotinamide-nucleotide amidase
MDPQSRPTAGTRVSTGVCQVRIEARAASLDEAEAQLGRGEAHAREALGEHIFGEDDERLEDVVVRDLTARGLRVAVAESCTGGMIAGRLTGVPGASSVLDEGFIVYANEAKVRRLAVDEAVLVRYGAVSSEVAEAMATGAQRQTGADIALSVTGIAGPTGGTAEKPVGLVYFGLAFGPGRGNPQTERRQFRGDRETVRQRATNHALRLLWEAAVRLAPRRPTQT